MATLLTIGLYVAFLAACAALLARRLRTTQDLKDIIPRAALALVCSFAYLIGPSVEGLEYEDAYIHKAAAVWQIAHAGGASDGFYASVCLAGSAADCLVEETFGTQLIGFSTLIALAQHIAGDVPRAGNVLSAIASILTLQIVWSMLVRYAPVPLSRLLAAGLLMTATSFYLISASGFSEPLFAFFLLFHLYCYLRITETQERSQIPLPLWAVFITSGALMILVKKEGALLVVSMLAIAIVDSWRTSQRRWDSLTTTRCIALISVGLLVFAIFILRIGDAADRHSADIGEAAFRLPNLLKLLPVLISTATSGGYFGLAWLVFALTVPATFYFRDRITIQLTCIVFGYALIYSLHARHRAFVQGGAVEPAEMVRYVYVLTPLAAVVIGRTLSNALLAYAAAGQKQYSAVFQWMAGPVFALGLLATGYNLRQQRIVMADDEYRERTGLADQGRDIDLKNTIYVTPYAAALIAAKGKDIIVADSSVALEPAVENWLHHLVANGSLLVINSRLCGSASLSEWRAMCELAEKSSLPHE